MNGSTAANEGAVPCSCLPTVVMSAGSKANVIADRATPLVTARDGARVAAIVEAIQQASVSGRPTSTFP